MSLLPFVLRDMLRPLRMLEHQMRLAEEVFHPTSYNMLRPRFSLEFDDNLNQKDAVIQDKEKFQLKVDLQNFKPEEISIKTIDGNAIQIEAKHEEKHDERGFISQHLVRRFVIPKGHDLKNSISSLSSDGVLTITAPRKLEELEERTIPISHVGSESEKPKEDEK